MAKKADLKKKIEEKLLANFVPPWAYSPDAGTKARLGTTCRFTI
jgi:hypothetical protein